MGIEIIRGEFNVGSDERERLDPARTAMDR